MATFNLATEPLCEGWRKVVVTVNKKVSRNYEQWGLKHTGRCRIIQRAHKCRGCWAGVYLCACAEVDQVVFGRWDDMWLCLLEAETQSDIISPAPKQLMWYLLSPWPPNPVSSDRSHLQCKTISADLKGQFLQSIDYKLHLENSIILTKGYSLSSQGAEGNPSFFNNLYV